MIEYPRFAPDKYKCLYCISSPLEIWGFVWIDCHTGKEEATPVLVCSSKNGCGTFFDPMEFDLTPNDLKI